MCRRTEEEVIGPIDGCRPASVVVFWQLLLWTKEEVRLDRTFSPVEVVKIILTKGIKANEIFAIMLNLMVYTS